MANFSRLMAETGSGVWGTPANFNGFRNLDFIAATTSLTGGQPNFVRCLGISWDVWASLGLAYYIYTFGGLAPPLTEVGLVQN